MKYLLLLLSVPALADWSSTPYKGYADTKEACERVYGGECFYIGKHPTPDLLVQVEEDVEVCEELPGEVVEEAPGRSGTARQECRTEKREVVKIDEKKKSDKEKAAKEAADAAKDKDEKCRFYTMVAIRQPKIDKDSTEGDMRAALSTLVEMMRHCSQEK